MGEKCDHHQQQHQQFQYRDGTLFCEELSLIDLAEQLRNSGCLHESEAPEDLTDLVFEEDLSPPRCPPLDQESLESGRAADCPDSRQSSASFRAPCTPFFVYSRAQIVENVRAYQRALSASGFRATLNYSVKANGNPHLLKVISSLGCGATAVSGNEIRLALLSGFEPRRILLNGNGKRRDEIAFAVARGCSLNVDSLFDARRIGDVASSVTGPTPRVPVLVRVNPDVDPSVHPYVATGLASSKFGVSRGSSFDALLDAVRTNPRLELCGLHCHLGSTVRDLGAFRAAVAFVARTATELRSGGAFPALRVLNFGGGLDIDYRRDGTSAAPSPDELVAAVRDELRLSWQAAPEDVEVVLEPGRSIVGDAAVLVTEVLGVKSARDKEFLVVDAAMTDVMRPSLYGAHHHAQLVQDPPGEPSYAVFDVVGPVCESADFLARDRRLPRPDLAPGPGGARPQPQPLLLALFDVGAYCSSMASNYNARTRAAELLVSGARWRVVRRADSFRDLVTPFSGLQGCGGPQS
ncbi:uncharacterized protein LOC144933749 [Lampetra fluviatilis]